MSIVQEALKKAQNKQQVELGQTSNKINFGPIVLLIVFIVLLGVTIKQFSAPSGARTASTAAQALYKPISSLDMKSDNSAIAEPYGAPKPKTVKGEFPNFVLNGIMELVDGPRAIVNNVIVAMGDVIGGATVKKIDKDRVILQKENSVVTLGMGE